MTGHGRDTTEESGQSSRIGDSSQYNICVINAGLGWIELSPTALRLDSKDS